MRTSYAPAAANFFKWPASSVGLAKKGVWLFVLNLVIGVAREVRRRFEYR
jgi:hypothetical protein